MVPIILSVGRLLPGVLGMKLSDRAAKITGIAILLVVGIAAAILLKCAYDASVVNRYRANDRADKAERQLDADRRADEIMANRAAEADDLERQLDEAIRDAEKADPVAASNKIGPVSQSYYDTLRKEKK